MFVFSFDGSLYTVHASLAEPNTYEEFVSNNVRFRFDRKSMGVYCDIDSGIDIGFVDRITENSTTGQGLILKLPELDTIIESIPKEQLDALPVCFRKKRNIRHCLWMAGFAIRDIEEHQKRNIEDSHAIKKQKILVAEEKCDAAIDDITKYIAELKKMRSAIDSVFSYGQ